MAETSWRVGDWVRMNPGRQGRSKEQRVLEGEIVYVGRRFAVVQLPGYCESFWLDELRPAGAQDKVDRELQDRVLEWCDA